MESGLKVYRDDAPMEAEYPYIVYEFVNETAKRTSSKVFKSMPMYQITVVTDRTEEDCEPLKATFNEYQVEYSQIEGMPYDENDDKIMQFITYVRCVR